MMSLFNYRSNNNDIAAVRSLSPEELPFEPGRFRNRNFTWGFVVMCLKFPETDCVRTGQSIPPWCPFFGSFFGRTKKERRMNITWGEFKQYTVLLPSTHFSLSSVSSVVLFHVPLFSYPCESVISAQIRVPLLL